MEANVNLRGWVGTTVAVRETSKGPVLRFRVATTSRYLKEGEWVDGDTTWWTVNAWRTLAMNAAGSLRKGDPVIVCGRLRTECWTDAQGNVHDDKVVEAQAIGHDLNRGETTFRRVIRAEDAHERPEPAATAALANDDPVEPDEDEGDDDEIVDPQTGEVTQLQVVR